MAISVMKKLRLIGLNYEKNKILNALTISKAVQITTSNFGNKYEIDSDELYAKQGRVTSALNILVKLCESEIVDKNKKADILQNGFEVGITDFIYGNVLEKDVVEICDKINKYFDDGIKLDAEISRISRAIEQNEIYKDLTLPFSCFSSTGKCSAFFGVIESKNYATLCGDLGKIELCEIEKIAESGDKTLLLAACHKSVANDVQLVLSTYNFATCPYRSDVCGQKMCAEQKIELSSKRAERAQCKANILSFSNDVKKIKTYLDFLSFEIEKVEASALMGKTSATFILSAYVPQDSQECVENALKDVNSPIYYEFCEVGRDEMPPTLMKNCRLVSNFETITNMYSPPSPWEWDPTTIMALFYSIFMGFIMGDVGYGLVMLIGGGIVWNKTKERGGGLNSLSGVFAIGGLFSIVMGVLCNSWLGISLAFMPTIIPDAQTSMWTFVGISVPSVLLIALALGSVQLMAGYICKAIQSFRRGQIIDGLCDGITWAVFALGALLAIVGLIDEADISILATVGGIICVVGIGLAALTAGRNANFIGKFTKGFGALYGIINFVSDILSYARLYGLMLSGAVIAGLVSSYGVDFITSGNIAFAILGIVLMLVGHLFNLAMSLLGAYIHDARLQYVEFYGKFFEGEGELFKPLGSKCKYIHIK